MEDKTIEAIELALGVSGCTPQREALSPFMVKPVFIIWYFNQRRKEKNLMASLNAFTEETGYELNYHAARRTLQRVLDDLEILDRQGLLKPNPSIGLRIK